MILQVRETYSGWTFAWFGSYDLVYDIDLQRPDSSSCTWIHFVRTIWYDGNMDVMAGGLDDWNDNVMPIVPPGNALNDMIMVYNSDKA